MLKGKGRGGRGITGTGLSSTFSQAAVVAGAKAGIKCSGHGLSLSVT